jgi:tetratricopeptide (TPR) repeat protein
LEKLPFILLSVAAGLLSLAGKSGVISEARPWANVTQAAYALLFYPAKIAFPHDISPFYPVPSSADLSSWPIVAYPLFVTAITIAVLFAVRRWPAVSIVWISYLVLVLPISGIVKYGPQLVADRYAYLSIAVFAIGLGFLPVTAWKKSAPSRISAMAAAIAAIFTLALMTWKQTQIWHDSETLFRRGVAVAPRSVIAHHNLAAVLAAEGRLDEAVDIYRRALAIQPYAEGNAELGRILAQQGKVDEAIAHDRDAIRLDSGFLPARQNLALLFIRLGRLDEAEKEYRAALKVDLSFVEGHHNLGYLLASRGRLDEAIAEYREALKLKPDFAIAYVNLGDALLRQGKNDEAIANFKRALEIDPNFVPARQSLEKALAARR